jgi:Cu+-exporting ATPase
MPITAQPTLANAPKVCPVNRTSIAASVDDEEADERTADAAAQVALAHSVTKVARCFHCGERCAGGAVVEEGLSFCCFGCQTVFALLTQSGLGQFYELASTPGARVGQTTAQRQWAFLDDPSVQEKLLDFADERQAKLTLHLPAIHCAACVWLLENLFRLRAGVGESRVNFARRDVSITFDRARVKLSDLAALLASLGYAPALTFGELDQGKGRKAPRRRQRLWLQVGIAGFGFGNVMLLALPGYLGLDSLSGPWFKALAGWLSLALALPVLVYSAADYWRAAWFSLKQRMLTLDVPIALGLAAIYGQSVFEVASGRGEGYCDSLTGLILFLLCGRLFQRKTFDSLVFDRDYKGFFPLAALRKTSTGEESIAISQLGVGERLVIRHSELVPADSRLVSGNALVDYSFVTGESEPVTRRAGELLYAGGRQVGGAIEVSTVKPVSESYLTSLWNNDAFRKQRDDDLDSLTNRYSRHFTVMVVGVAIAAAVFWMVVDASIAMKAFTSVLIVACPCALALAAPLTLGAAHRWLAGRNVFLRNANVIERMSEVDVIVLDKTGTLTSPGAGTTTWSGVPLTEREERWLYSMTRHSAHPLAVRIAEGVRRTSAEPVLSFIERPGCGMEGCVAGREILMGSAAWLESRGVRSAAFTPLHGDTSRRFWAHESASEQETLKRPEGRAPGASGSSVHVAIDGGYRGGFVLESALLPEVDALIRRLRGSYQLVLLSGDNASEAERFTTLFGEKGRVEFNQSPFDKLNVIRELQTAGRKVMMVGDGLNDAGALKQSDVGVAVVEQVGTFSPASDVILDAAQLPRLSEVLAFSRRAARVVRAGFVVSGLYNVVGVSIAAAGLLSPLVCAVLMPLSSVTVVVFAIGATHWVARNRPGVRQSSAALEHCGNDGRDGQRQRAGAVQGASALTSPRKPASDVIRLSPATEKAIP